MTRLAVDGAAIAPERIAEESARFADAADPEAAARRALAVRELLLARAGELGLLEDGRPRDAVTFAGRDAEDAVIAQVLDRDVATPQPTDDECRRWYDAHRDRYVAGELVEASHILFAVTVRTPVPALRDEAERTLAAVRKDPASFATMAGSLSNCPSGAQGGSLGQFGRGTMVPEFDRAVFGTGATGVLPTLVATRHGFHVVHVERRIEGAPLPFEAVRDAIAAELAQRATQRALAQYVARLAGAFDVEGVDIPKAVTPLVQ